MWASSSHLVRCPQSVFRSFACEPKKARDLREGVLARLPHFSLRRKYLGQISKPMPRTMSGFSCQHVSRCEMTENNRCPSSFLVLRHICISIIPFVRRHQERSTHAPEIVLILFCCCYCTLTSTPHARTHARDSKP